MKILLVQPKMIKRPMDTDLKTRMSPSLALLTLASLTPSAHETVMINENVEKIDYNANVQFVAITVTLDVMPRACRIAEIFQKRGIPVVAGGIHITGCPQESSAYFDAICVGAAERVWKVMIEDALNGSLKKIYRDMDGFEGGEIASPAYASVDPKKYLYTNIVTTSRGCPHKCDFCYNSCENSVYVRRPIEDVIRDIKALHMKHILFIDDNFIGSPAYTRELLSRLRRMNLKWSAAVTAKIGKMPELLDLMAQTGCQSLFIGFESINDASLQAVNKGNSFSDYDELVQAIHSRGIMINASMVFGLDGDTPEVFANTLQWLVKNRIETLTSHILTPYPGTRLYQRMDGSGRITDYDLSRYNTSNVVFEPAGMTAEELREGYLWMYRKFYSFQNIMRRMPKCKKQRTAYVLFNIFYRKFGRFTSLIARIVPMRLIGLFSAKCSYHYEDVKKEEDDDTQTIKMLVMQKKFMD